MTTLLFSVGIVLLALMSLILYRAVIGPSSLDRIVAVNVIGTKTTVLLIIIGFLFGSVEMFVDLALTYAMFSFRASIAMARFIKARVTRNTWEALGVQLGDVEVEEVQ